jgi:3-methyladenine DNA glycosylase/8-oxoguanine DNA glycosylase
LTPVDVRVEVRPRWPYRLPRHGTLDGLVRVRHGVVHRLLHLDGERIHVRVAQTAPDCVLFGAVARTRAAASHGIARMRCALGIDQDVEPFHRAFRHDPLLGTAIRRDPTVRVAGRPEPFEALAWAVCEQLIEFERAAAIERRLIARLGRRCAQTGLRDAPAAAAVAGEAPARLASFDLAPARALTLIRVAREVAAGRVDLHAADPVPGWRRLRAIPGVGSWTIAMLASAGQGRLEALPAGDLAYVKLVGRVSSGGDPWARATEDEVNAFFAPYHPWGALAGAYALRAGLGGMAAGAERRLAA